MASFASDISATPGGDTTRRLGLWDTVGIIVGIVVGTAIFISPPLVFQNVANPWQALGMWLAGGVLSLMGALCYAELATTYPRSGGDYVYLSLAYGPWAGFLFGWAQLCIILTGSIGAMAYAFAEYGVELWGLDRDGAVWLAVAAVTALSAMNLLGVVAGKLTQNVLSAAKILGLALVVAAGIIGGRAEDAAMAAASTGGSLSGLGLALVFVLYAYGGWNDAAFVSAEVQDARRNIPRSLFISIGIITGIYLLVNATFLYVLGFDGARQSSTPAADVLQHATGPWGAKAVSVLVMISALGAINGLILTGSRVFRVLGEDHRTFAALAHYNPRTGVLLGAVAAQAFVSVLLILAVGTAEGRHAIDRSLSWLGIGGLPWEAYHGGFETLVAGTAPVFWTFFLLTGAALFVLRYRSGTQATRNQIQPTSAESLAGQSQEASTTQPFTTPWYPLPPVVFCLTCLYMLYASLDYARGLCLIAIVPVALGVPLYLLGRSSRRAGVSAREE